MSKANLMATHPIDAEIFDSNPHMSTGVAQEGITKFIRIHPQGTMNVYTKLYGNPYNPHCHPLNEL